MADPDSCFDWRAAVGGRTGAVARYQRSRDWIVARIRSCDFLCFHSVRGIDRSGDADRSRIAFGTGSFYFAAGEYLATPVAESHDRFHVYPTPSQNNILVGQTGTTLTRLAPMGKVRVGEVTAEAKTIDGYINPRQSVEVIGFENTVVIVRAVHHKQQESINQI